MYDEPPSPAPPIESENAANSPLRAAFTQAQRNVTAAIEAGEFDLAKALAKTQNDLAAALLRELEAKSQAAPPSNVVPLRARRGGGS